MRYRLLALPLAAALAACSPPDDDVPTIVPEDTADETSVADAGPDTGPDTDTGGPGPRTVVFEGKDPEEATYRLVAGSVEKKESIESNDRVESDRAEGRIEAIRERDVYTIRGEIRELQAGGNVEVRVDGEARLNGREVRSRPSPDGEPRLGMTIHSSVELLETNGRVSERVIAKFAARAFQEAGFGYRIVYNLFPQRPPDEKSNCSAGEAPQWWGSKVGRNWRRKVTYSSKEPTVYLEEDVNILMLTANGGGCGAIGGLYGTTPALNIDEMREWSAVGTGDWHRNIHGTLHEIGHQLGARHDHDDDQKGAQHPGNGWNEVGPDGKTWWHRTPTTAGNGAPNRCGSYIKKRQSQPNVRRHQTFANCAVRLFELKPDPDSSN